MAIRCPNCGVENPEGKKFCGDCGAMMPPPMPVQPAQSAVAPTRTLSDMAIVGIIVLIIVVIMTPVLVYTMPLSKIKVIVSHSEYSSIGVDVYIDGVLKSSTSVRPGTTIVGVWSVDAGTHEVVIDRGSWYYYEGWFSSYWTYDEPDGYADFAYVYEVGPLYTKNVHVTLT